MKDKILKISKSKRKGKKYEATILRNGKKYKISFGALGMAQYKDNALGLYSSLDHLDPKRRKRYLLRMTGEKYKYKALEEALRRTGGKVSANYLSVLYLW